MEQRLSSLVRALAARYRAGALTLDELRAALRPELARLLAAAVLAGTGGRRGAAVDELIRQRVEEAWRELDDLIALVEEGRVTADGLAVRLEAFESFLEDARADGEALARAEREDTSPLVPIALGSAAAALIAALARRRGGGVGERIVLPRVDMGAARELTARLQAEADALAAQLASGELSLDNWRAAMRDILRRAHLAYYRMGRGAALTPSDIARVEQRLKRQYDFLDAWHDELAGGDMRSEAALRARARMYLNAGNASLQDGRSAAVGLPPLPAYPGDGTTICRANCKCTWQVVRLGGVGNFDCYWRLRPAEHCPTCEARAAAWQPIQARGGQWLPFQTFGLFE